MIANPHIRHALLSLALALGTTACEVYDPPPEARLVQPTGGFWSDVSPIEIAFTEPIEAETLVLSIWPSEFDIEGEFRPGVQPLIDGCTLTTSPCALGLELRLNDARDRLTLIQHDAFVDYQGRPLVIILSAGLKDLDGRERKVDTRFDFQINPRCGNEPIDVDMTSGVITMAADLQVLPIALFMYFDVAIDPATGKVVIVGTFARLRDGAPAGAQNFNPEDFEAELGSTGWAVTFTGCVVKQPDGGIFLQSDPFDVNITVLGAIPVTLLDFMVQGTIRERADPNGRDTASGTLSTSGGSFQITDEPTDVEPITTAWNGLGVFEAELPEGLPRTCAEEPCAAMREGGGDCQLPSPWEPGDVCPAPVAE